MKSFLLVDDHAIVRAGLKLIIKEKYNKSQIDEAAGGDAAFELVKKNNYDLIIVDLHIPNTDTSGFISNVLTLHPAIKILVFTMNSVEVYARRLLKLGVAGFLNKDCKDEEVEKAIDCVMSGRKYLPASLMADMLHSGGKGTSNPFDKLSNRELEITILLIKGRTVQEISNIFSVQPSTIGSHKIRIFEKLKVDNVIDLGDLAKTHHVL